MADDIQPPALADGWAVSSPESVGLDGDLIRGIGPRPRDLLKIGQLVLDGGRWQNRQVVSRAWIEESTAPHINGESLSFYGYQWWLGRSLANREEIKGFPASAMAASGFTSSQAKGWWCSR